MVQDFKSNIEFPNSDEQVKKQLKGPRIEDNAISLHGAQQINDLVVVVEEAVLVAANGMEELSIGARRVFVVVHEGTPSEKIHLLGYLNRTPPEDL